MPIKVTKHGPLQVADIFDHAQVVIDGKRLRALRIVCFKCGRSQVMRINTMSNALDESAEHEHKLATRKFARAGWEVGARAQRHLCPSCVLDRDGPPRGAIGEKLLEKLQATPALKAIKEEFMGSASGPVVHIATPPRTMSREDKRIIFGKLDEVYNDDKTGYQIGWTDQKVAVDLGVPRAWVTQVREDMFGPLASNPEIEACITAAQAVLAEARAKVAELLAESTKLSDKVEGLERRLIDLMKTVRP